MMMTTEKDISTGRVGGKPTEKDGEDEKEAVPSSANSETERLETTSSDDEENQCPELSDRIPPSALATAVHSFQGEEEDELSFPKGAKISDIVNTSYLRTCWKFLTSPARVSPVGEVGGLEPMRDELGSSHPPLSGSSLQLVGTVPVCCPINQC